MRRSPPRLSVYPKIMEGLEERRMLSSARVAIIGDYGLNTAGELAVSNLVKSWNPDVIATAGDNNYELGAATTIDANVGKYYHDYISPYAGAYGAGSTSGNRFFPVLGNHDWFTPGATPYLNYFSLPGNERYYSFTRGPVQFFMLDSDSHEPDLNFAGGLSGAVKSKEAQWLQAGLAASTTPWQVVILHHAPFSSGTEHGSSPWTQWPFQQWGADAVVAGHEHNYERIMKSGLPYIVNGLGGAEKYPSFGAPVSGSAVRYQQQYGALRLDATDMQMNLQFINIDGAVIDSLSVAQTIPPAPSALKATAIDNTHIALNWVDNSFNETGFEVQRSTDGANFSTIARLRAGTTAYTDAALVTGTRYTYRVRATNLAGASAYSAASSAIASITAAVPAAPANLTATPISTTQIQLRWQDVSSNETSFVIEKSTDGIHFYTRGSLPAGTATFTDGGLTTGVKYWYRLKAANATGLSAPSNVASATPGTSGGTTTTATIPRAPSYLTGSIASSSAIRLTWRDNSNNESGFEIQRSVNGQAFATIARPGANITTWTDTALTSGSVYSYRIRAVNSAGATPYGNIVTIKMSSAAAATLAALTAPNRQKSTASVCG